LDSLEVKLLFIQAQLLEYKEIKNALKEVKVLALFLVQTKCNLDM